MCVCVNSILTMFLAGKHHYYPHFTNVIVEVRQEEMTSLSHIGQGAGLKNLVLFPVHKCIKKMLILSVSCWRQCPASYE